MVLSLTVQTVLTIKIGILNEMSEGKDLNKMKIRGDFVTNSSSSSYIAFKINSELLASIIREETERTGLKVDGNVVSFKNGGASLLYDYDEYCFTPRSVEDVFRYVYYVIRSNEGIEYWPSKEASARAARAIKDLYEKEPGKAAASVEECEWRSETDMSGEFMDSEDEEESKCYYESFKYNRKTGQNEFKKGVEH